MVNINTSLSRNDEWNKIIEMAWK